MSESGLDKIDLDLLVAAMLTAPNVMNPSAGGTEAIVNKFESVLKELQSRGGAVGIWKKHDATRSR